MPRGKGGEGSWVDKGKGGEGVEMGTSVIVSTTNKAKKINSLSHYSLLSTAEFRS